MEAIVSEASNIEIPIMVGYTEKERNFAEQCLVKLKRNYETSVITPINLVGDFDANELQF